MTKIWWCSWTFPESLAADERIAASWPAGLTGWITGHGGDDDASPDPRSSGCARTIFCARVEAPTRDAAVALVASMYGGTELRECVRWRFGPDEKPDGWWPQPDRFPRSRG